MDKLAHWEIPSTDMAKSKEFYSGLFGGRLNPGPTTICSLRLRKASAARS